MARYSPPMRRPVQFPWKLAAVIAAAIVLVSVLVVAAPAIADVLEAIRPPAIPPVVVEPQAPSQTPTPTVTFTATPSPTPTETASPTPTLTPCADPYCAVERIATRCFIETANIHDSNAAVMDQYWSYTELLRLKPEVVIGAIDIGDLDEEGNGGFCIIGWERDGDLVWFINQDAELDFEHR